MSAGLREHFELLVADLATRDEIGPGRLVFDIGSNDGSVLASAKARGAEVLGIDPAVKIAEAATAAGIPTIGDFFSPEIARRLRRDNGPAAVILCFNTLANIDDLNAVFEGIVTFLADDGLLIVETQYAVDMVEKLLLDVIYHEHISYFAVAPVIPFAKKYGLELIDAERIAPKGGSIRFSFQRQGGPRLASPRIAERLAEERGPDGRLGRDGLDTFRNRVDAIGAELRSRLQDTRRRTGRALAFGSSVGCAALVHYFELGGVLEAIYDDNPLQSTMRVPGGTLPVLSGAQLAEEPATDVAILAWRYSNLIVGRHTAFREKGGRFYRVLPDMDFVVPPTNRSDT